MTNSNFEGRLVKTVKVMRVLFIIFHTNFLNTSQHAWHNIPWYDKHKRSRDIFWCFLIITCHVTASKFHTGGIDQSPPSTHSYPQPDPTGYPLTSQRASQPMSYHLFWIRSCTCWIHNIHLFSQLIRKYNRSQTRFWSGYSIMYSCWKLRLDYFLSLKVTDAIVVTIAAVPEQKTSSASRRSSTGTTRSSTYYNDEKSKQINDDLMNIVLQTCIKYDIENIQTLYPKSRVNSMIHFRVIPGNMVPEISGVDTTFPYKTISHIDHNLLFNNLIKRLCDYFFLITLTMKTLEA